MAIQSDSTVVIRAKTGPLDFSVKEIWQFRDLLLALSWRDIRLRYSQTFLGVTWVILQPLLGALVFTLVFSLIAKLPSGGTPYFVISYAGLLGWNLFSATLTRISSSLVSNANLITRVFFPRIILPLETIPCALLDFFIGLGFMIVLVLMFHLHPAFGILLVPIAVSILIVTALGIGLVAASLAVRYRDIQHIVPLMLQLLMYGSPVGYSMSAVPGRVRQIYSLNPLAAPIECMRAGLIGTQAPDLSSLGYSAIVAILLFLIGAAVFRHNERNFADVI